MRTRRQTAEGRRRDRGITRRLRIVLRRPRTRIQLVMERVIVSTRQVRQHLERYVRSRRQGEVDYYLTGRRIRRRAKVLVRAIIRPLNRLAARGRRIAHHHKR